MDECFMDGGEKQQHVFVQICFHFEEQQDFSLPRLPSFLKYVVQLYYLMNTLNPLPSNVLFYKCNSLLMCRINFAFYVS